MGRWGDGEMRSVGSVGSVGRWGDGEIGSREMGSREMGRWGDLIRVGFLHLGKTWDDREGEEKENNEEAMHRFLIPHTPHPTPHTPHLRSL
ncbi:MAG: hypothetical protein F6K49_51460 [Moorea sp. SIO3I6]|nr:hypothetical protein [Moorena sp. SIO3I6]